MVNLYRSLIALYAVFFLTFLGSLSAQEVKVTSSVDGYTHSSQKPIPGTISITHEKTQKVDLNSFHMGDDPLKVELAKETIVSPARDLTVSFYKFTLTAKDKGLYILPPITVKVGGKEYASVENTYEVVNAHPVPNAPAATSSPSAPKSVNAPTAPTTPLANGNASLTLVGSYEASPTIYPGEQIRMVYKYTYNTNIELTEEKLPLLDAPGFTKIGSREIKDSNEGDTSIREISQLVTAPKAGQFDFPVSLVEGNVYRVDDYGVKQYQQPKISAESPPVSITVTPFPSQGRPTSFNGAVGTFSSITATLNSPKEVTLGDKITLGIDITGTGSMETVPLPELCCQPGFSGFFQQSDLPPVEKVSGKSKHFDVELRPLALGIPAIPSIEFSYFDPATKTYNALHSEPLPIAISDNADAPVNPAAAKAAAADNSWKEQPQTIPGPTPENVNVVNTDTHNYLFSSWWVLLFIPLGALLLYMQRKKVVKEETRAVQPQKPTAELLFKASEQEGTQSPHYFRILTQAFLLRLVERGEITSTEIPLEQLPVTGAAGQVREILTTIEEKRFTGQPIDPELIQRAKTLFHKL